MLSSEEKGRERSHKGDEEGRIGTMGLQGTREGQKKEEVRVGRERLRVEARR